MNNYSQREDLSDPLTYLFSWLARTERSEYNRKTLTGFSSRRCARFTGITVCFYTRDIGYGAGRRATEEEAVAAARKTRLRQLAILPSAVAPVAPEAYAPPFTQSPSRISRRESRQVPGPGPDRRAAGIRLRRHGRRRRS